MDDNFIKIINSTYRLLDFFPDNDPLKGKSKEKALKILENLALVSESIGWSSLKNERVKIELSDDIEILKGYLQLGKYQGWIGGINYLILNKELDELLIKMRPIKTATVGVIGHQLNTKINLNDSVEAKKEDTKKQTKIREDLKKEISILKNIDQPGKISERQEKILKIISNKGDVQVADIIKQIPNITKRTIRRDMDDLLNKAKIIRRGEWNKVSYQINPNQVNDIKVNSKTSHFSA
ncbi:MAG: DeoR family transcriptional regulator [Candidatus Staskawiczbacteria bacterium]|nr:DeoR family transcriptional regulator [Candidatus Staskawiczbacteria bacterium]